MGAGGTGGTGGGDGDMGGGGGAGGGGTGGGGGSAQCTPKQTINFTVSHPSVAAGYPRYLAAADINGDGNVDLVTSNYTNNTFSVLLGDGKGGFTLAPQTPVMTCGDYTDEVVARDVTGDGKADLIITCVSSSTSTGVVNVYVNTSTTATVSFGSAQPVTLPDTTKYYYPVVGKFSSGAAHPGLALAGNNHIYWFNGAGDGTFSAAGNVAAGGGAESAAVADLNGDGVDDIVAYNYDDEDLTLALSKSGGGYATSSVAGSANDMGSGQIFHGSPPVLVDFNGDGLKDIVISQGTSQTGVVDIYKNTGSATAPAYPMTAPENAVLDLPIFAGVADFNCDGALDVVVSSNGCAFAGSSCPGTPGLSILPAHGAGFDGAQTTVIDPPCDSFVIYDFNNDGNADVACGGGDTNANTINLLLSAP